MHTQVMCDSVRKYFDTFPAVSVRAIGIDPRRKGLRTTIAEPLGFELADEDEDAEGIPALERVVLKTLHTTAPIEDPNVRYATVDAAKDDLRECFGDRLPRLVNWGDVTTDLALSRFATQGLVAHRIERRAEGLVVDLEHLLDFGVRPGLSRYGAKLVLDEQRMPVRIERAGRSFTPSHPAWELAKLRFRSAAALDVTVRDHALHCHLIVSNAGVIATRRNLSPDHPIRRLLLPFQFRTPTINRDGILTLAGPRAVFHRIFGLEWEELVRLYRQAVRSFRFDTFEEARERRGIPATEEFPYWRDGGDLWRVLETFVDDYLLQVGPSIASDSRASAELDAWGDELTRLLPADIPNTRSERGLREILTYLLFNATGYHEQVGGAIGDYVYDPRFAAPALRDAEDFDAALPSRNTMHQSYMLGVLTNLRMPRIVDDIAWLFREASARHAVERFTKRIHEFDAVIAERNAQRAQPLFTFAPRCIELSVSL